MRIAVTGAGGFVGLNLVHLLCARGHAVVAIDRGFSERACDVLNSLRLARSEVDVRDPVALGKALAEHRPEALFHGAAVTADLARERRSFSDILDVNVTGAARTLEACHTARVRRVIVASSSAVYGDAVFHGRPKETDSPEPATLYGISKLTAERAAIRFGKIHGMDVRAVRISAVFGPWEHRTGWRDVMSPLFQVAERAASGQAVSLHPDAARDWIDARRVAAVLADMMERDCLEHHVYNLGGAETWSPRLLCDSLRTDFPDFRHSTCEPGASPDIDYNDDLTRRRHPLDTSRIRQEFGSSILGQPSADAASYAAWISCNRRWFQMPTEGVCREA